MEDGARVIILGIDALNFGVLDPLIDEGAMPNFKKLREGSAHSVMKSIIPSVTGPAWTSINTGKNPGKHGIFDFVRVVDGSVKVNSRSDIDSETFMELLSGMGKRCITVGVPYTYPPGPRFKGIAISDFLYPDVSISPKDMSAYIEDYKSLEDAVHLEGINLIDDLLAVQKGQIKSGKTLFEKEEWDLFFFYMPVIDHFFHKFFEEIGSASDAWKKGKGLFIELDSFLGWILERLDDRSYLMIISDHGFRMYDGTVNLNRILESWGYMKRSVSYSKGKNASSRGLGAYLARFVRLPVIFPVLKVFNSLFKKAAKAAGSDLGIGYEERIDFLRSAAFTPTKESMGIYINDSQMTQGLSREDLLSRLRGLEHEGVKVFDRVVRREDIYSGPHIDEAPDHLFLSERFMFAANIFGRDHFGPGEAYHDMDAVFFLKGPSVRTGGLPDRPELVDIAPTVLSLFGIDPPSDMDGRILKEAMMAVQKERRGSEIDRIRSAARKFGSRLL